MENGYLRSRLLVLWAPWFHQLSSAFHDHSRKSVATLCAPSVYRESCYPSVVSQHASPWSEVLTRNGDHLRQMKPPGKAEYYVMHMVSLPKGEVNSKKCNQNLWRKARLVRLPHFTTKTAQTQRSWCLSTVMREARVRGGIWTQGFPMSCKRYS